MFGSEEKTSAGKEEDGHHRSGKKNGEKSFHQSFFMLQQECLSLCFSILSSICLILSSNSFLIIQRL